MNNTYNIRQNTYNIMVTKEFTEDMKKIIIKKKDKYRDDRGRLIPKEDTPDDLMYYFETQGYLPEEWGEDITNYYKIRQVDGKAILCEDDVPHLRESFDQGNPVNVSCVELEIIPYNEHVYYGINNKKTK